LRGEDDDDGAEEEEEEEVDSGQEFDVREPGPGEFVARKVARTLLQPLGGPPAKKPKLTPPSAPSSSPATSSSQARTIRQGTSMKTGLTQEEVSRRERNNEVRLKCAGVYSVPVECCAHVAVADGQLRSADAEWTQKLTSELRQNPYHHSCWVGVLDAEELPAGRWGDDVETWIETCRPAVHILAGQHGMAAKKELAQAEPNVVGYQRNQVSLYWGTLTADERHWVAKEHQVATEAVRKWTMEERLRFVRQQRFQMLATGCTLPSNWKVSVGCKCGYNAREVQGNAFFYFLVL
jgi:hypothetical protein